MATLNLQPASPLAADGRALARVLQVAGINRKSAIRVAGSAAPAAVIWLNRHGYDRAAFVHANRVASVAAVDALLIPQVCGARELADLIEKTECIRAGGVLIVQTPPNAAADGRDSVADLLVPRGYQIERRVSDCGRNICIARRLSFGFEEAA